MKPRPGIKRLLEVLDDKLNRHERVFIFAELPTGYGKTTAAPYIYKLVSKYGVSDRIIHVLPLRAIIRNLLEKIVVTEQNRCRFNEREIVGKAFAETGIHCDEVAYQMGDYVTGIKKEPLFDAKYIITTIDSFVHNLFKIPITELYRERRHYFIPYGRIFTSTVIFDEAHIALGSEERKTVASLIASIKALLTIHVPVIIMTATLTPSYEDLLIREVKEYFKDVKPVVIRLDKEEKNVEEDGKEVIKVVDEGFEREVTNLKYEVEGIEHKEILSKIHEEVNSGRRVLVVINDIDYVKNIYRKVRENGISVGIIHSKLTRGDRELYEKELENVNVLVGTSAIEAGVDVSFNSLITVLDNPMSFVQRIGRVCRKRDERCKDDKGRIYLITDDEHSIDKQAIEYVKNTKINWRLPYNTGDARGYMDFLNQYVEPPVLSNNVQWYIELLREVFSSLTLEQKTLQRIFSDLNFSLVRSPLIDIYIMENEGADEVEFENFIKQSFMIELNDLSEDKDFCKALINCGGYVAFIDIIKKKDKNGDKNDKNKVKLERVETLSDKVCGGTQWFRDFIMKFKASPVIVTRRVCYEDGVGFRRVNT